MFPRSWREPEPRETCDTQEGMERVLLAHVWRWEQTTADAGAGQNEAAIQEDPNNPQETKKKKGFLRQDRRNI